MTGLWADFLCNMARSDPLLDVVMLPPAEYRLLGLDGDVLPDTLTEHFSLYPTMEG